MGVCACGFLHDFFGNFRFFPAFFRLDCKFLQREIAAPLLRKFLWERDGGDFLESYNLHRFCARSETTAPQAISTASTFFVIRNLMSS